MLVGASGCRTGSEQTRIKLTASANRQGCLNLEACVSLMHACLTNAKLMQMTRDAVPVIVTPWNRVRHGGIRRMEASSFGKVVEIPYRLVDFLRHVYVSVCMCLCLCRCRCQRICLRLRLGLCMCICVHIPSYISVYIYMVHPPQVSANEERHGETMQALMCDH